MLQNAFAVAKIGFATAENEPSKLVNAGRMPGFLLDAVPPGGCAAALRRLRRAVHLPAGSRARRPRLGLGAEGGLTWREGIGREGAKLANRSIVSL